MTNENGSNRAGTSNKYELLLIFERFTGFEALKLIQRLKKLGYSERTLYRWKRRHEEADRAAKVISKEL